MTVYYVELTKIDSFGSEVEADSLEEAQDKVLLMAPGSPTDWTVSYSAEVQRFRPELGAAEIL